ncbi:hypothetical protein NQZ68_003443 [Dissostichus eleginoides]|nr:hypothetical protein NQZ68_003443 [Dissostichus eleginoides]
MDISALGPRCGSHHTPSPSHCGKKTRRLSHRATTMSLRFTVSKSDGDRRPSDIQGEVNQLFEGDEPNTSTAVEGEDAAGSEVVVELKGREILKPAPLFVSYTITRLYASSTDA